MKITFVNAEHTSDFTSKDVELYETREKLRVNDLKENTITLEGDYCITVVKPNGNYNHVHRQSELMIVINDIFYMTPRSFFSVLFLAIDN